MKKLSQFIKNNKYKIGLAFTILLVFLVPKLRVLFQKKQGKKVVNHDGTKPIDNDYEIVNDTYKQADIIAKAIYSILHLPSVPVKNGYYDQEHPLFKRPDYSQVISLMNTNKSIIQEIQERFEYHYKKDVLNCFPYHTKTQMINYLKNTFADVTNFTIVTVPTRKVINTGLKDWAIPTNHVYDTKNWSLGDYYYNYYNQLTGTNVPLNYIAY